VIVKHETTKNIGGIIRRFWSVIPLIIITLVASAYTVLLFTYTRSKDRFYWYYVKSEPSSSASTVLGLIVVIALISLIVWFILNVRRYGKHLLGVGLLSLTFVLCGILSYFSFIFFYPNTNKHLDEVRQDNSLYRLAYWDSSSDGNYYVLFECDSIGILCSEICATNVENDNVASPQPKIFISGSPQLISIVDHGQTGNQILCSAKAKP